MSDPFAPSSPAAQQTAQVKRGKFTAADFSGVQGQGKVPFGFDAGDQLFKQAGISNGWETAAGESGDWRTGNINPSAIQALDGYSFDWNAQPGGFGNTGTLTAYTPAGEQFGSYQQTDSGTMENALDWGKLAMIGFGGVGALTGLGPMGGMFGGMGAGEAAGGGLMGPPVEAAGFMGPPIEAAGAGLADASTFSYAMPGAEQSFGVMNAGGAAAPEPFIFNAAADSQAANAAMQAAGTPTGAALAPAGVNLGSAGGVGATSGLLSGLGQAGDAIYAGLGSIGSALKQNPGLASAGASLLAQGLSSANSPTPPSQGAGGSQGTIDAQSKANMDAALLQAQLNRVDTVNPLGSTRYNTIDDPNAPGGKRYEQVTSLAPGQQQLFDATQSSQIGQAQMLDALTKQLSKDYANPLDFSGVPGLKTSAGDPNAYYQDAADAMYSRATRYLDPEQQQATRTMEGRLAEQGFVPGTPAYQQAMQTLMDSQSRARGDARDSALLQGLAAGQNLFSNNLANANLNNTASGQTLAQMLQKRAQPLNELNAVRSGTQVQVPSANAPSPVSINAVDVAGINNQAYQNNLGMYNANVASNNAQTAAMGQLGTALLQYFSDARLKDDVRKIGTTPGGTNLYAYTIFGRPEIGVLAQELLVSQPAAVSVHESGFFIVDYSKVR
jgi:hypothetical protein